MSAVRGATAAGRHRGTQQPTSAAKGRPVSDRPRMRVLSLGLQFLGAALVIVSAIVGLLSGHAAASGLSNGTVKILDGSGHSIATNPLAGHQMVTVSVGPNSTLSLSSLEAAGFPSGAVAIKIIECADPEGSVANLPKNVSQCDARTLNAEASAQPDGSVLQSGYEIFALPDPTLFGASDGTTCDAEHQCVLGIFSNQEDFTKPHLFSAPFLVSGTSSGGGASTTGGVNSPAAASAQSGASAGVSVPPATLANTGGPTLWPWLLGGGTILLLLGTVLRSSRRFATQRRR